MANFIYSQTNNDYTEDMSHIGQGYIGRRIWYSDRRKCWMIDNSGSFATAQDAIAQCHNEDRQYYLNQQDY